MGVGSSPSPDIYQLLPSDHQMLPVTVQQDPSLVPTDRRMSQALSASGSVAMPGVTGSKR